MKRPEQYYIDEWERHPDVWVFEPTCVSPHNAAQAINRWCAFHFEFPVPLLTVRRGTSGVSTCEWRQGSISHIELRTGFAIGELLHELAHAYCFDRYGDHEHDARFAAAMDEICFWFRLDERAQAAFFP